MSKQVFLLIFFLFLGLIPGCGGKDGLIPRLDKSLPNARTAEPIVDPQGPIPKPDIPPDLAAAGKAAQAAQPQPQSEGIAYSIETRVEDTVPIEEKSAAQPLPEASRDIVLSTFERISTLYRLQDTPPETSTGIEQRLTRALDEARNVMHSYGYYAGKATGTVEPPAEKEGEKNKPVVRILFSPGRQYRIGRTSILTTRLHAPDEIKDKLPVTLAQAGLESGDPAIAADVLAAVNSSLRAFLDNGYPFAKIASTQYIVDHEKFVLEVEVRIAPGAFVRMGDILRSGAPKVKQQFIEEQRTWAKGRPWSQSRIESFNENLRQTGLFQKIELEPGEEVDADGRRVIKTTLVSAPERTLSGAVKYHSDFGPGVEGGWEHRNLTGYGDSLRVSLPLWIDMQELTAIYRRPHFLNRYQDFIAKASVVQEDVDAYRMQSGRISAGVERKLSRRWSGTLMASIEGGSIKESDEPKRSYMMFGLPSTLTYDSTNSLLNAEKGSRVRLSAAPYIGSYDGNFSAGRGQLELQKFIPLVGENKLVLALRGMAGALFGTTSETVPPSIRFYTGGGGSVRGYEYQSIGPKNKDNDPEGGGSVVETSAEARWRITPEIGLVGFVDGGTVYEDTFKNPTQTVRWGAGVGFRYYTTIGPVRFDIATPLNPRGEDDPFQVYISIGQSF